MKKIYLGFGLIALLSLSACSINGGHLKKTPDLSSEQEAVFNDDINEDHNEVVSGPDWFVINEWNLKYPAKSLDGLAYKFDSIADFPGKNEGLTSVVSFTYQAPNDDNNEISLGWEKCQLPSITEYTIDPTNEVLGATSDTVKKINDKYYLLESGIQEPCHSLDGETIISGVAESLWKERRGLVFDIFNSLQGN